MKKRPLLAASSLLLAGTLSLSACSGKVGNSGGDASNGHNSTQPSAASGNIKVLHLPSEVQNNAGMTNYNPYAPSPVTNSNLIFEPLMYLPSTNCQVVPALATAYKWVDNKTLDFTIRDGVKWSDGQPMTAQDVVFTINLAKQYPAMDTGGIWSDTWGGKATSVSANGSTVEIKFSASAVPKFEDIIALRVLPQHVYSKVGDPTKYIDKNPVGTGAYKVTSYNGTRLVLDKRSDYWQADKIKVDQIVEEGVYQADGAALALSNGKLDAYFGEIPNVKQWGTKSNYNHYWYAPAGSTVLTPNTQKAPFNDAAFRNAYTLGLDKTQMSQKATYGVMGVASQTGLKLPQAQGLLPDQYKDSSVLPFDIQKANDALDAAGYKVGSDGFRTNKDGSPLKFNFTVQAGWIDYDSAAAVIVQDLKQMKLNVTLQQLQPDAVDQMKKQGTFDMMLEYLNGGCTVARNLGSKLDSNQIPTKTTVLSNVERWNDPATDQTVTQLSQTADENQQKQLVGKLVDTMMTKSPVSPLFYAPARMIFRTQNATGWPSADDPYASGKLNMPIILTHLSPVSK